MSIPRLYCPGLQAGHLTLSAEEVHHAAGVLRLKQGEAVELFDGAGGIAQGVMDRVGRREVVVAAGAVSHNPFEFERRLTIAVAAPKAHRQSYLIENCTELGAAAIWPLECARSVATPGTAAVEKWRRRAIEAAKQSRRCWVPRVELPRTLGEALSCASEFSGVGFMHPDARAVSVDQLLASIAERHAAILMLIGPEGGWTDGEVGQAAQAGATMVHMGPAILRTETAAMAVCAVCALRAVGPASVSPCPFPQSGPIESPTDKRS